MREARGGEVLYPPAVWEKREEYGGVLERGDMGEFAPPPQNNIEHTLYSFQSWLVARRMRLWFAKQVAEGKEVSADDISNEEIELIRRCGRQGECDGVFRTIAKRCAEDRTMFDTLAEVVTGKKEVTLAEYDALLERYGAERY